MESSSHPANEDPQSRRWADVIGVTWVVLAVGAVMSPALIRGSSLGAYDWLSQFGLSQQPHVVAHNVLGGDQITQMIPWSALAWTQVHAGHIPLWNPFSALGTPLAFNWQSAPFSLPALVGYLFPLRLAYTAQAITTMIVAGTGTYVLARVLRCTAVASAFAATVFELSGAFMLFVGWPIASVMSCTGWLFALAILIIRGRRRARNVILFALALAFAIYAGQPDAFIVLIVALAVFLVVILAMQHLRLGPAAGPIRQPLTDLLLAGVAGTALAAPLLLPGLSVLERSIRNLGGGALGGRSAFPILDVAHLLTAGLNGKSISGDPTYLGAIPVVFAILAIAMRWRRPEVVALAAVALVMAALSFVQPVVTLMASAPGLEAVRWPRAVILVAFPLAVLSGLGMDELVRSPARRSVRLWLGALFVLAALVLLGIWIEGKATVHGLPWPAIEVALGLTIVGSLALISARSRNREVGQTKGTRGAVAWFAAVLLFCETVFLVLAGGPLWASSPGFLNATPSEAALRSEVGSSLVGLGSSQCYLPPGLGIRENVNVMLGVQEMAVYDPMLPVAYYHSWATVTGQPATSAGYPEVSTYCPPFTSATIARTYGVSFVLEPHGSSGPSGGIFDTTVGNEDLYRIPNSGLATVTTLQFSGSSRKTKVANVEPVAVTHPDPASWSLVVRDSGPATLRLRITNTPGWHASLDGRPLALTPYKQVMLQAHVPGGVHQISLRYWPETFTVGIVLALCSLIALIANLVADGHLRRRRQSNAA